MGGEGKGVRLRVARPADLPDLVALLTLLLTQESDFTPNLEKQRAGLSAILAKRSRGRIYVIEVASRVVGMASLVFTISTAMGGRAALFEDFIVHPSVRGRGYGKRLLAYVLRQASRIGARRLTLLTDADNDRAQRLYTNAGFTRSAMVPMRRLMDS